MTRSSPKSPRNRLRNILSNGETLEPLEEETSPLSRLPKAEPKQVFSDGQSISTPQASRHETGPFSSRFPLSRLATAFWTVTGIMSLVVNGILIALVIYLLTSLTELQLTGNDVSASILSSLYNNFEKMDRASINTIIPVDAEIPLDITIPIHKTTTITLASDAVIQNARVRITSAALNIDAPAQVTLPAGTSLDIFLEMDVPVQTVIPIHLEVPVNIPLSQTQLHEPFSGLQQIIKPFYCMFEPSALNLDGEPVCR